MKTILWIDDDGKLIDTSARIFKEYGIEIVKATNSSRALTVLRKQALDGVLLDVRLSAGESGLELLEDIHHRHPELPVVVFTGYPDYYDHAIAQRIGASVYFKKIRKSIPVDTTKKNKFFAALHKIFEPPTQKMARKLPDKLPDIKELEISIFPTKWTFDADGFCTQWVKNFGGEFSDVQRAASNERFIWKGETTATVLRAAESGVLDRVVKENRGQAIASIKSDSEYLYDFVPEITLKRAAKVRYVGEEELLARKDEIDVVILTVTDVERNALLSALRPWPGTKSVLMGSMGQTTYRFGRFGNYRTAHVESTMGAGESQGALLTAQQAINDLKPKAFLILGIAFGVDRTKQQMGDVLVATSIFPYDYQKRKRKVVYRGHEMACGEILSERFRVHRPGWTLTAGPRKVNTHLGLLLSGDKLINDRQFRDDLIASFELAIGGEMEGHGAYAAAKKFNTEMILIKGICDWADGHKNDQAQPFAAYAAVALAEHVLSKPDVLKNLGAVDVDGSNSKPPAGASSARKKRRAL